MSALGARFVMAMGVAILSAGSTFAADYVDADAALRDGVKRLQLKKYDEARSSLEAALKLAPDDAFRLQTYQALVTAYRELQDPKPMITAREFIIGHSDSRPERAITSRNLANFLFQRGLLDEEVQRYEKTLKKSEDDLVATAMLAAVYQSVRRDEKEKRADYAERLEKLEQGRSQKLAKKWETEAAAEKNAKQAAYLWKSAAVAWRDAGKKECAVAAADRAEQAGLPDSSLLVHFYHRHLGEVYADCDLPTKAISHLEKAIASTETRGYRDACQTRLDEVRKQLQK